MNMTLGGCQLSEEANAIADTFQKQGDKPASMATCKRHNIYTQRSLAIMITFMISEGQCINCQVIGKTARAQDRLSVVRKHYAKLMLPETQQRR